MLVAADVLLLAAFEPALLELALVLGALLGPLLAPLLLFVPVGEVMLGVVLEAAPLAAVLSS